MGLLCKLIFLGLRVLKLFALYILESAVPNGDKKTRIVFKKGPDQQLLWNEVEYSPCTQRASYSMAKGGPRHLCKKIVYKVIKYQPYSWRPL